MASSKAIKLKVDKSGRIVVPKALRQRWGFGPGSELEAVNQSDGILLRKTPEQSALRKINGVLVHMGVPEPGLDWDRIVDDAREERIQQILKSYR
jgi:AbrB family looped-hinge helix DNA binding protein